MREWTTVTSPDMEMSLWNPFVGNSVIRNVLRQLSFFAWPSITDAVGSSLSACVDIHIKALRENASDILVGSSWGGGIVLLLLALGEWKGAACIICPALTLIESYVQSLPDGYSTDSVYNVLANFTTERKARILLVHGTADTTVNIGKSRVMQNMT
jgi:hypothetical protein